VFSSGDIVLLSSPVYPAGCTVTFGQQRALSRARRAAVLHIRNNFLVIINALVVECVTKLRAWYFQRDHVGS
jgi:hypothetical protein